jgi:hypothetical protein
VLGVRLQPKEGEEVAALQRRSLRLAPRILGILMAIFISLFAFDVFGEGSSFWEALGALFVHLVPTYLVIIALVLAWRCEWMGAVVFIGLGIFYVVWSWGRFPLVVYFGISGPLVVIGVLFLLSWLFREEKRGGRAAA